MNISVPTPGTLEVAAALAFHLPGARLDLSGPNGANCSVGPLTDPRCQLHPAEFRELVVAAGAGGLVGSMLGCRLDSSTRLSLAAAKDVEHLGGGLYRVAGRESVSFTFATTLQASDVDAVLSQRYTSQLTDRCDGVLDETAIAVSLIQDDGLGVTLVVICASDVSESDLSAGIAQHAMSACLVTELEKLATEPDGSTA